MSYSTMKRSVEMELISAEGLKVNKKSLTKKKKTYCMVRIDDKSRISKLDESGGGSYPIWKDKINMEMPINGSVRFIPIEVFYRTSGGQQKNVGHAEIPVTDFIGRFAPQGHLNFLSYRLRDAYGDKCGIVNVSVMVKPDKSSSSSTVKAAPVDYAACSSQAANGQLWRGRTSSVTAGYGGGIVTGIPVWCAYQRRS